MSDDPGRTKSHAWFDRGASAFAAIFGGPGGVYACPQCLRHFTIEDLDVTKELTIEHVPPESVGGVDLLLTCKRGNNTAGTALESDLHRHDQMIRFASGLPVGPIAATFDLAGAILRGQIESADGTITMLGVDKWNRPEETAAAVAALSRMGDGDTLSMTFTRTADSDAVSLAWLRAAYLTAFAAFGYAYVCQPSMGPIRAAINTQDARFGRLVIARASAQRGDRGMFKLAEPEWLADAVVVVFDHAAILLPPVFGGLDPLAELDARRDDPDAMARTLRIAFPYEWPTEPRYLLDDWVLEHRDP